MKTLFRILCLSLLVNSALAAPPPVALAPEVEATYKDMKDSLGIVPSFLKAYPEAGIAGAWMDMKTLQLSGTTAIPGKYKELIGLAVSAQIPCEYCTYFHGKAANLHGATPAELKEAVAIAAISRRWGTILEGSQVPMNSFKKEVNQMLKFGQRAKNRQAMEETKSESKGPMSADDAYADMKQTFGFVPSFVKSYPKASIGGLWLDVKGIEFNPETAIPPKYKNLIGLAVAAQSSCEHCLYFSTQSALAQGASREEISEAIAMAGITRQWSTVLNGNGIDRQQFERETDQIMSFVKGKMEKKVTVK